VSTIPVDICLVDRKVTTKDPDTKEKTCEKLSFGCPDVQYTYNKKMGGVDLVGFFTHIIKTSFKSFKWTHHVC
jgi:hypothetical protein